MYTMYIYNAWLVQICSCFQCRAIHLEQVQWVSYTRCTSRGYTTEVPPVALTVGSHLLVALIENLVVQWTSFLRLITSFLISFPEDQETATITSYREGQKSKGESSTSWSTKLWAETLEKRDIGRRRVQDGWGRPQKPGDNAPSVGVVGELRNIFTRWNKVQKTNSSLRCPSTFCVI